VTEAQGAELLALTADLAERLAAQGMLLARINFALALLLGFGAVVLCSVVVLAVRQK